VSVVPRAGRSDWVAQKYLDCADPSAERAAEPLIVPRRAEIDGNAIVYACTSTDPKNRGFCHTYMTAVGDPLAFSGISERALPRYSKLT
jgi:hypothetical protein